jgi:hypothetical protein
MLLTTKKYFRLIEWVEDGANKTESRNEGFIILLIYI